MSAITDLFLKILNMSVTAGFVILAILPVRLLLRNAPKKYSYVLWGAAAFRLCCPVSFRAVFSLFQLKIFNLSSSQHSGGASPEYIPGNIEDFAAPEISLEIPSVNTAPLPTEELSSTYPVQALLLVAACVWIVGILVLVTGAAISYVRLRHQMRTAVLFDAGVYQSNLVRSPFILGLFRPKIYIPFGLDDTSLNCVLAHERHHIKRLDHLTKFLAFFLLVLHWFNPLCWLAFYLMSKDQEMSCDEMVLSANRNTATDYSTVLLAFASNRRLPIPTPLAFSENGVKGRIKHALKWKQPKVWVTIASVVLCLTVVVSCAANPIDKNTNTSDSPYAWASTVQLEDVDSAILEIPSAGAGSEPLSLELTETQLKRLIEILNGIPSDSVYTGRGAPYEYSVILTCGEQVYKLNYSSDMIELSFDEQTAKTYDEGIWEIHASALTYCIGQLVHLDSTNEASLVVSTAQVAGSTTIVLRINNATTKLLAYDPALWHLECFHEGSWTTIEWNSQDSSSTFPQYLPSGQSDDVTLPLDLAPGIYRISKEISYLTPVADDLYTHTSSSVLSAIFAIQ